MRTLTLALDRQNRLLLQSDTSSNPLTGAALVQHDVVQIIVRDMERNTASPPLPLYLEQPLVATSLRTSVVNGVNAPPTGGSFKLQVGDQVTAKLTWPADLSTAALVATWKAAVLAALKALSNVGTGGILPVDPPNAPPHFLSFVWTDITRETPIACVQNELTPPIDFLQSGSLSVDGYSQLLSLLQFPVAATAAFSHPTTPPASIVESVPGAAGRNEEQTLIIPAAATGTFALTWSGAQTVTLPVAVTALQIEDALNAIVPLVSFAVSPREGSGTRFAIQFIGPLVAAAQPPLGVTMYDQASLPYAQLTLDLRNNVGIAAAINGTKFGSFLLELCIDEDERYLLPLFILAAATGPQTMGDLEATGAVATTATTVYLDSSSGDSYQETAPGYSFVFPAAASSAVITHGLTTWEPRLQITQFEVNHTTYAASLSGGATPADAIAASITGSHRILDFAFASTTVNQLLLLLPYTLLNDPTSPLDYRLFKIRVASPDAQITLWTREVLWSDCVDHHGGTPLDTKLATLDAALGLLGGTLSIPAGNITGQLSPTQLNLTALATALSSNATFATALGSLFQTNASLTNTLITTLGGNTTFATTLQSVITNTTAITDAIATNLTQNSTFNNTVQNLVYQVIQGGQLPANATIRLLPDYTATVPAYEEIAGPTLSTIVQVPTTTTTTGSGGQTITTTQLVPTAVDTVTPIRFYQPLSPAVTAPVASGNVTVPLPATAPLGNVYDVPSPVESTFTLTGSGRNRGRIFLPGEKITYGNGHWYSVLLIGSIYYPVECELELGRLAISPGELLSPGGARCALSLPFTIALLSDKTGVNGRCELAFDLGARTAASAGNDVSAITWANLFSEELELSPALLAATFSMAIQRASGGTLTGTATRFGKTTTFTPSAPNFDFRARLTKFDIPDVTANGALQVNILKALATIIAL